MINISDKGINFFGLVRALASLMIILNAFSLRGQCPDKEYLWNRIIYLRDSSTISLPDQLKELFPYLEKLKACPDHTDSTLALLYQRIGAFHFLQGDFIGGIDYTKLSMKVIYDHLHSPSVNPAHLIKSYYNLQICYDSLGKSDLKTAAMDSCISLMVRLKAGYNYGTSQLYLRTRDFYEVGDYYKCIDYSMLGERIARETGYGISDMYNYIIWRINALNYLNRFDESENQLLVTIAEAENSKADKYLGALYGLMARIQEEKGDEVTTLRASEKAFYYDYQIGNFNGCAETLNNVGYFLYYRKLGKHQVALIYHKKALRYADAMESLNILDYVGNEYASRGLYDSALHFYQLAFDKLKPGLNEDSLLVHPVSDFAKVSFTEYIVDLILDKAEAYLNKYKAGKQVNDIQKAKRIYKLTDRILDIMKRNQTESLSKIFWRRNSRRLYENGIETCYLTEDKENAFFFFERSRAVLLQDQLNEQKVLKKEDIASQYGLKKRLNSLEREIQKWNPGSEKYSELYKTILQEKLNLERLEQQIRTNNPIYFQAFLDTSIITLQDVQHKILAAPDLLLEQFYGDSAVFMLFIGKDLCRLKKIEKTSYNQLSEQYFHYLSQKDMSMKDFTDYLQISNNLYKLIFIENAIPFNRLVISPDGNYFPFEALVVNNNGNRPEYMVEKSAISYTFSARYLINEKILKADSAIYDFMGIAPVRFPELYQLAELGGSDHSLNRILPYFHTNSQLIGNEATKSEFFNNFYKYRVVQLYSHGSDSGYYNEPVIYFADSALLLSDLLYQYKPSTELVIISACKTGTGKFYQGEGVFSFSRGFAALGIPSSITNLWSVENESTYKLTELFYKYLAKGLPLDVALQKAKIEFLNTSPREKQLPYFWAAQILAGHTDPILIKKPWPIAYILAGLGAGIIILLASWNWKARRKTNRMQDSVGIAA